MPVIGSNNEIIKEYYGSNNQGLVYLDGYSTQLGYDGDASLFFNVAGITSSMERNAVNSLVVGLKSNNLWNKIQVIYPFVGGTANTCKYNLKNPTGSTLTYYNYVTPSSASFTFNNQGVYPISGSQGWIDSGISNQSISMSNSHFGIYVTQNTRYSSSTANDRFYFGPVAGNYAIALYYGINGDEGVLYQTGQMLDSPNFVTASVPDMRGFLLGSRISSTSGSLYLNGALIGQNLGDNPNSVQPPFSQSIVIGQRDGNPQIDNYNYNAFNYITWGTALTTAEAQTYNSLIFKLNWELNRTY